jgi:large subunit ribosomal protein L4
MELAVYNISGSETGKKASLNDDIFNIEPNDHAIYLDVKQYLANQRQGTHSAKKKPSEWFNKEVTSSKRYRWLP